LLFHRAKIFENIVERLVVPKARRKASLELAHEKLDAIWHARKQKNELVSVS